MPYEPEVPNMDINAGGDIITVCSKCSNHSSNVSLIKYSFSLLTVYTELYTHYQSVTLIMQIHFKYINTTHFPANN